MKTYVGVKVVCAEPSPKPDGSEPGYKVVYEDGYESWSPADVFEAAYLAVEAGDAELIEASLKEELERLANGGFVFDAISAEDEARRLFNLRETAVHLAASTLGDEARDPKLLFGRASMIVDYIMDGVVTLPSGDDR